MAPNSLRTEYCGTWQRVTFSCVICFIATNQRTVTIRYDTSFSLANLTQVFSHSAKRTLGRRLLYLSSESLFLG